jgi:hypothetical protein
MLPTDSSTSSISSAPFGPEDSPNGLDVIHLVVTRVLMSVFGEHTHISGSVLTENTHFSSFNDSLTIPEAELEAAANGTLG